MDTRCIFPASNQPLASVVDMYRFNTVLAWCFHATRRRAIQLASLHRSRKALASSSHVRSSLDAPNGDVQAIPSSHSYSSRWTTPHAPQHASSSPALLILPSTAAGDATPPGRRTRRLGRVPGVARRVANLARRVRLPSRSGGVRLGLLLLALLLRDVPATPQSQGVPIGLGRAGSAGRTKREGGGGVAHADARRGP
eukprot:scaffold155_cov347-Pavlova_lutheri.AAC.66